MVSPELRTLAEPERVAEFDALEEAPQMCMMSPELLASGQPKMSSKRPRKRIAGRFPHSDRNAELQEHSFRALINVLPPEKFVFREERKIDAGVDGTIEIKVLGDYTGMRSYVQVKSCEETPRPKKDGSIAYAIETSNLHYLLNHPSPLYVLYVLRKKEIRYVWAWEEVRRIESEKPTWEEQKTVTLLFKNKLNSRTVHRLHERIRSDSTIDRGARTILSRAGATETVILEVDKKRDRVSDPDQIRELLLSGGLSMVSCGAATRVLELISLLRPADRELPKILLVSAYAEFLRSRYLLASGRIAETLARANELSDDDRDVLVCLKNVCDHQCGRITTQEYQQRQKEASENSAGAFAISSRIFYLRQKWLAETNPDRKREVVAELASTVEKALSEKDSSKEFNLQAKLTLLFARGGNLLYAFSHSLVVINMRIAMGIPDQAGNELSDANAELNQWLTEAKDVVRSSSDMKNPRLCGEALYTRAIIIFAVHSFGLLLITPEARQQKSQFIIDTIIPSLHNAIQLYEIADDIEGVLRAKVLMAEFYDLVGDRKRGHDLAVEAWSAPPKLVQPKWKSPGRLTHGGTHEKAKDRRGSGAVAAQGRPRSGQGTDSL